MRFASFALALALALPAIAPAFAADPSAAVQEAVQSIQTRKMEEAARIVAVEESQKEDFDGLYAEFQQELAALNEQYAPLAWRLLEKSVPALDETKRIIRDLRDLELKKMDLREAYFEKFGTILKPAQMVRLFQLENKADILMKYEAATRMPILQ